MQPFRFIAIVSLLLLPLFSLFAERGNGSVPAWAGDPGVALTFREERMPSHVAALDAGAERLGRATSGALDRHGRGGASCGREPSEVFAKFAADERDPAGSSAVDSRASGALRWAEGRLRSSRYRGYCLSFVSDAYHAVTQRYGTATKCWKAHGTRDFWSNIDRVPTGALLYFGTAGLGHDLGHVAIHMGGGKFIHATSVVRIDDLKRGSDEEFWKRNYRGWSIPPDSWPGR